VEIRFISDLFNTGDRFEVSLYEDSLAAGPFTSHVFEADGNPSGLVAYKYLYLEPPPSGVPWQDLQGWVRFELLNGSVEVDWIRVTHSSMQNGEFIGTFDSSVIPEPSTASLLALGLVGIAAMRRRTAA
jgi:hypothetical protein